MGARLPPSHVSTAHPCLTPNPSAPPRIGRRPYPSPHKLIAGVLAAGMVRNGAQVQEQGLGGDGGGGEHSQRLMPPVLSGLLAGRTLWVSDSHRAPAIGKVALFGVSGALPPFWLCPSPLLFSFLFLIYHCNIACVLYTVTDPLLG